jgi:hypothetical protein
VPPLLSNLVAIAVMFSLVFPAPKAVAQESRRMTTATSIDVVPHEVIPMDPRQVLAPDDMTSCNLAFLNCLGRALTEHGACNLGCLVDYPILCTSGPGGGICVPSPENDPNYHARRQCSAGCVSRLNGKQQLCALARDLCEMI